MINALVNPAAVQKMAEIAKFCYENDLPFRYSPRRNCVKITNQWHSLDKYYNCVTADDIKQSVLAGGQDDTV